MLWFWAAVGGLLVVLLATAAASDLYWRRKGFRHEIRGYGRHREKVRIRIERPDDNEQM